eukprot:15194313-Alexandrium_andersonii.AAC.1
MGMIRANVVRASDAWRARAQLIDKCEIASGIRSLNCADPGATQDWLPTLPRVTLCAVVCAESAGGDEMCRRSRCRRISGG